jgi:putative DNA methylase
VKQAQQEVYDAVDRQIVEWGIEENEQGWRADTPTSTAARLVCPECGWRVPLLPTLSVAERMDKVIAELVKLEPLLHLNAMISSSTRGFQLRNSRQAKDSGTITSSGMVCPNPDARAI